MEAPARPAPPDNPLSRPYWEAARAGRFVVQQCTGCQRLRHYPRLVCSACFSTGVRWHEISGSGRIHSWTVTHHAFHPAFAADLPYALVTVDLEEGVRALGRWSGGDLAMELPVCGRFVQKEGQPELVFSPA
jgi:uncharacterized OB-fold protein